MHVIVLGNTTELSIFCDLMKKASATVQSHPSITVGDLRAVASDVDVLAYSSETLSPDMSKSVQALAHWTGALACDISDGADMVSDAANALPEHLLQAATGLAETTGFPEAAPTISKVPFIAVSSALYAASIVLALSRCTSPDAAAPSFKVSRYLTAINALTTFLPAALQGATPTRIGNQHPSSSPWNTYPTEDGWVLICTSKDPQWEKLRDTIAADAVSDPKFDTHAARIEMRAELDGLIAQWTQTLKTEACVDILLKGGVPVGPILTMNTLFDDPNLKKRQPQATPLIEPDMDASALINSLSLYRVTPLSPVPQTGPSTTSRAIDQRSIDKPLAGLRVIELGQFTTAPLACRHLAHLGADVLKIEAPSGEPARHWKPILDGVGHFFTISNTGKRFQKLNLRDQAQLERLKEEIRTADIIVENMRPDVMGKLGLGHAQLAALNPNVTLCSISGFGAFSAYPGRAAYDTIIQGMSGMMDLTRSNGRPAKLGISGADILGAQMALFAILSTLDTAGQFIDVSMQDVAAYAAILGLKSSESHISDTACRTVNRIVQNKTFVNKVLTKIPDPHGVSRLAPRLPYRVT